MRSKKKKKTEMTLLVDCEYLNGMSQLVLVKSHVHNELFVCVRYSLLKYDYKIFHETNIGDKCHLIKKTLNFKRYFNRC